MGTNFKIVLYAPGDSVAEGAARSAFGRIEELNGVLSDYEYSSELNRLSRSSGTGGWRQVSPALFRIISKAQQVAHNTSGAFDITVGPYVQLWRRMNSASAPHLPHRDTLAERSRSVGYRHIRIDSTRKRVKLSRTGMQLDAGGIAKGYAADEAVRILRTHGIGAALVDAGGDLVLGDPPPGTKGWRISLLSHTGRGKPQMMTLRLANRAVATSGDLFQHVTIDGKRYSHIIDPRTGLGLENQSLVTVIAQNGITADSYASAVSVLGPEQGMTLIEMEPGLAGFMEYRAGDSVVQRYSAGFEHFLVQKKR